MFKFILKAMWVIFILGLIVGVVFWLPFFFFLFASANR